MTTRRPRTPPSSPTASSRAPEDGARVENGVLRAQLPPRSWNMLRLRGVA